jgi:putative ABC transport system permease protein
VISSLTSSWLTALRIARREARRAKGRSALVLAMVALPVLGLAFAAASYDMFTLTTPEKLDRQLGTADASLRWQYEGAVQQDPTGENWNPVPSQSSDGESTGQQAENRGQGTPITSAELTAKLPANSRAIRYRKAYVDLRTAAGVGGLEVYGLDVVDPLARGIVKLRHGRAPDTADEVAVTEQAATRLGVSIGGTVRLADDSHSYTVVGLVEFPASLSEIVVFPPDTMPAPADTDLINESWLLDAPAPVTWDQVKQLNQYGIVTVSRSVVLNPPPADQAPLDAIGSSVPDVQTLAGGFLVSGLALLEVVLLAGPAFAVGARRRQRDLALVAANGGTPAHLRRIVLADGVVLGTVAAVVAVALGILVAFTGRPLLEEYLVHHRAGGYRVYPLAQVGVACLAVLIAVLAALVPAFTAARQDVVRALTGRRGVVRSRKRWLALGILMAALGAAITGYGARQVSSNIILTGMVVGELGLVLCTPSLVGLISRLGGVLPLAPRIALRDTARNRSSASPAISAVMAAVAGGLALGVYLHSSKVQQESGYAQTLPLGYAAVALPTRLVPVHQPDAPQETATQPAATAPLIAGLAQAMRSSLPVDHIVQINRVGCPAGEATTVYCSLDMEMPQASQCPYVMSGNLTAAQQKLARQDKRCDAPESWYTGVSFDSAVDDGSALATLTGAAGDDLARASAALRAGGVVVTDFRYLVDGKVTLMVQHTDTAKTDKTSQRAEVPQRITVPGYLRTTGNQIPSLILSPGVVATVKLAVEPAGLVAATTRMPTQAEQDRLGARLQAVTTQQYSAVERGPSSTQDPTLVILALAAGVVTLGAAGIATGLAAADGRRDLSTLAAVGASPRVRRALSLSQSGVIAGLGSVLGVLAGLGAAFAVLSALNQAWAERWPAPQPYPLAVPWQALGIMLAVPLVAMLGAGLLTRSRLPIERRLD